MFNGSIASYPERGVGGDPRYRGNCSPRFVEDYLLTFNPQNGLVVDPMEGSGTTRAVCQKLGMPYRGFDLKEGFDARTQRLRDQLDSSAQSIFLHPPYAAMVRYSRDIWRHPNSGRDHEADLSRHGTDIDAFIEELTDVLYNAYDALAIGGTYAVLLGLWRHPTTKELVHLPGRILPLAPGTLVNEIIKAQHNMRSAGVQYGRQPFAMTTHEVCLIFRKQSNGLVGSIVNTLRGADAVEQITWRALLRHLLRTHSTLTNEEAYNALAEHPRAQANANFKAKIRQSFQKLVRDGYATRTQPGCYTAMRERAAS